MWRQDSKGAVPPLWGCRLMAVGANPMLTGIPNLVCGEKETLVSANSSNMI